MMNFVWEYFWWFWGLFGIAVIIFWPLIVGTQLGRMLLAIGAAVLAGFAALARARQQGIEAERRKQERLDAEFLEEKRRRDAMLDGLTDAELDGLLRDGEQPKHRPPID